MATVGRHDNGGFEKNYERLKHFFIDSLVHSRNESEPVRSEGSLCERALRGAYEPTAPMSKWTNDTMYQ